MTTRKKINRERPESAPAIPLALLARIKADHASGLSVGDLAIKHRVGKKRILEALGPPYESDEKGCHSAVRALSEMEKREAVMAASRAFARDEITHDEYSARLRDLYRGGRR